MSSTPCNTEEDNDPVTAYIVRRKELASTGTGYDRHHRGGCWIGMFNAGHKVNAAEAFKAYTSSNQDTALFHGIKPHLAALKQGDLAVAVSQKITEGNMLNNQPENLHPAQIINRWYRQEKADVGSENAAGHN